jgi:hypothetical protein
VKCTDCQNVAILVFSELDKEYVKEVNNRMYDLLGPRDKYYYNHTRCVKCDGQQNMLYGGMGGANCLTSEESVVVCVNCYDERWYLTFSNCLYGYDEH